MNSATGLGVLAEWRLYLRRRVEQIKGTSYGEPSLAKWLSECVHEGDLCIDVGANVGRFTDLLLRCGARVVAIEPQAVAYRVLSRLYGGNERVSLERVALGRSPGSAELHVGGSHTLATLSAPWMNAVTESGRFTEQVWPDRTTVQLRTLDSMILHYGRPHFCKIDVEGFEAEVVAGLSEPIPIVTFEYSSEITTIAVAAVERLSSLGSYGYNISLGESGQFVLDDFRSPLRIIELLSEMSGRRLTYGNVVARLDVMTGMV